ncbi:hypothetical protein B0A49_06682, partial [Cryomyces minteri]
MKQGKWCFNTAYLKNSEPPLDRDVLVFSTKQETPTNLCGASITTALGRTATMGGVIEVDGEYFGMTVSHLFDENPPTSSPSSSLTLDFDEDDLDLHIINTQAQPEHAIDHDDREEPRKASTEDCEHAVIPNFFEFPVRPSGSLASSFAASPPAFSKQTAGARLGVLKALSTGSVSGDWSSSNNLDWALVSVEHAQLQKRNTFIVRYQDDTEHKIISNSVAYAMSGEGCTVYLATGTRGVVSGLSIKGPSTLGINEGLLEVWVVQLNETKPGDCGSWAFGTNGELLGMLIATCVALCEAYLAPVWAVLGDIRRTGRTARLPLEGTTSALPERHSRVVSASASRKKPLGTHYLPPKSSVYGDLSSKRDKGAGKQINLSPFASHALVPEEQLFEEPPSKYWTLHAPPASTEYTRSLRAPTVYASNPSTLDYAEVQSSTSTWGRYPPPLSWSNLKSDSEMVQHLRTNLNLTDLPEVERPRLLLQAAQAGHEKTVELLLEEGFADAKSGITIQKLLCTA